MNIIKRIFLIVLFFLQFSVQAEDVEVVVEPKEAVVNENFFVTFKIKASGGEEPFISFTPYGASVLGKRSQGLSISTIVINGKFTTTKEQAVVYELMAERTGQVYLRNIKVEVSGKTIPLKEVRINVLSEPRRIPDAFMEAEASKTRVYIGEGLDVNYYLYFKSSISANDVKEFPKLNKFIKRFHHINSPVETVQYKGQVLKRILAYSARLYPEKVGNAVLDPMKISVQILENDYGGFGFGNQRFRNKDLASPIIEIEVLPLPSEGVPASFTGLVGEHEFLLTTSKSKFMVNEPIELKLEVKGKGAVENLDAPVIYSDNNLEQFDTKSEVTEIGHQMAKKVFEYTMLARGPVTIAPRELALAYFEPATGKYIEKKISIPALSVSGVAAPAQSNSSPAVNSPQANPSQGTFLDSLFSKEKEVKSNELGLVGPVFGQQGSWTTNLFSVLNIALLGLIFAVCAQWFYQLRKGNFNSVEKDIKASLQQLRRKGLSYPELYKVLSALDQRNKMATGGVSINNIVEESPMTKEAKEYFKDALVYTEQGAYSTSKSFKKIEYNSKYFNELLRAYDNR